MQYIIALCILVFAHPLFAAVEVRNVDSVNLVPISEWYSLDITDNLYKKSWNDIQYKVSSSRNVADWAPGDRSNTTDAPNTWESSNIYNDAISNKKLRAWDVNMYSIPLAIVWIIELLLAIAGTIAIVALIYHAFQMQINSGITWDASWVDKAKKWIYGALIGFTISLLAWFIVTRVVEILQSAT